MARAQTCKLLGLSAHINILTRSDVVLGLSAAAVLLRRPRPSSTARHVTSEALAPKRRAELVAAAAAKTRGAAKLKAAAAAAAKPRGAAELEAAAAVIKPKGAAGLEVAVASGKPKGAAELEAAVAVGKPKGAGECKVGWEVKWDGRWGEAGAS